MNWTVDTGAMNFVACSNIPFYVGSMKDIRYSSSTISASDVYPVLILYDRSRSYGLALGSAVCFGSHLLRL